MKISLLWNTKRLNKFPILPPFLLPLLKSTWRRQPCVNQGNSETYHCCAVLLGASTWVLDYARKKQRNLKRLLESTWMSHRWRWSWFGAKSDATVEVLAEAASLLALAASPFPGGAFSLSLSAASWLFSCSAPGMQTTCTPTLHCFPAFGSP